MENLNSDKVKDCTDKFKVPIYVKDKIDFLKYYEKEDGMFSDNILKSEVFWRDQIINGVATGKVEIKPAVPWNKTVNREIRRIKD